MTKLGGCVAALALAAFTASEAAAVPIEGTDAGDVASLGFAGGFTIDTDSLTSATLISPASLAALGISTTNGFATTDGNPVDFSGGNFSLGSFVGTTFTVDFASFGDTSGNAELDEFSGIPGGTFSFAVTDASINHLDTAPVGSGLQSSFEIVATGTATVPAEFDPMPEFSLVINGSIVDGADGGTLSGTITSPPAFAVPDVPEPATMAILAIGALGAFGAQRSARKAGAKNKAA